MTPVQSSVSDRFTDLIRVDDLVARQVGDGAGKFQDAVIGAGREPQLFQGAMQQAPCLRTGIAESFDLLSLQGAIGAAGTLELLCTRSFHPSADTVARFHRRLRRLAEQLGRQTRDLDMHIDTVKQRTGYALAIAGHLFRSAATRGAGGIAEMSAGAETRCLFPVRSRFL